MSRASTLKDRAALLAQVRAFFASRGVMEVDPGALVKSPPNDAHIECLSVDSEGFLHTSPEYAMKRLLAEGSGDIYYLGHVYRKEELGRLHNPEFTMIEWYRCGISFADMIRETCELLSLFLGPLPVQTLSYRRAFELFAGPHPADADRDYLLTHKIEPELGRGCLTVLTDYPPDAAALACVVQKEGEWVAERYEIYYEGIELCNGYHELNDAVELRRRFAENNKTRTTPYPLDELFLASLHALPDCCGVAVGFDRALMLRRRLKSIHEVLPCTRSET